MQKIIIVSALTILTLAGCSQSTEPDTRCQDKAMPGGWSESTVTPEAQRAINTVIAQMNNASPLKEINEVRTQVVSGINYAIEFTLENGEVWHTVVHRNLRNDYMIEQIAQLGPLCP